MWFAPVWAEAWPRKYRRRGIVCQLSFLDLGGEEYVHGLDKSVLAAAPVVPDADRGNALGIEPTSGGARRVRAQSHFVLMPSDTLKVERTGLAVGLHAATCIRLTSIFPLPKRANARFFWFGALILGRQGRFGGRMLR